MYSEIEILKKQIEEYQALYIALLFYCAEQIVTMKKYVQEQRMDNALLLTDTSASRLTWGYRNPLFKQWVNEGKILKVWDGKQLKTPRKLIDKHIDDMIDSQISYIDVKIKKRRIK